MPSLERETLGDVYQTLVRTFRTINVAADKIGASIETTHEDPEGAEDARIEEAG